MEKTWIVASAIAVGLLAAACSSSSKSTVAASPTTPASPTTTLAATASGAPTTTIASGGGTVTGSPVVTVATDPKFGMLLVGPNGHTLYLFEDDKGTTSACTGAGCVALWHALSVDGTPTVGAGVDQTKVMTATGQVPNQVVYNGHLLYYFTGDTKPGDVQGITIPHWDPIAPSGAKVETGN